MERGGLVFGFGFACLALLVAGGGTALQIHHPSRDARLIVGTLLAVTAVGMFLGITLGLSIVGFNWPKMLVPPQHRAAPGTLTRRRRTAIQNGRERMSEDPGQTVSLLPGEQVRERIGANRLQDGRVYEGHLHITNQRLVFLPTPPSRARGLGPATVPFAEIAQVDVAPRGSKYLDGSVRHRLRVTKSSGEIEMFVVWRPNKAADLINQCRQES